MDAIKITLRGRIGDEIMDFVYEYHHYVYDITIEYAFYDHNHTLKSSDSPPIITITMSPDIYDTFLRYLDFIRLKTKVVIINTSNCFYK